MQIAKNELTKMLVKIIPNSSIASRDASTITVIVPYSGRAERNEDLATITKIFSSYNARRVGNTGSKTGSVKIGNFSVEVKGPKSKDASFKPSDIKPSIVDNWLTADQIVKNVHAYINSQDLNKDDADKLKKLLDSTNSGNHASIPYTGAITQPEFFEVLTAVKLAALLAVDDKKIRETLGIPDKMNLRGGKIQIKIPKAANFPLVDYFMYVGQGNGNDDDSMRISVKSKVKSPKSNTVKFNQFFDVSKTQEVDEWFKSLDTKTRMTQKSQKIVAESVMQAYRTPRKTALIASTLGVLNLLKNVSSMRTFVSKYFTSKGLSSINLELFESILEKIKKDINSLKFKDNITVIREITPKEIKEMTRIFDSVKKRIEPHHTIGNIAVLCDRILQSASSKNSGDGHDYYKMFWDQVLVKKELAYAVASKDPAGSIKYDFYSKHNFRAYKKWIGLKTSAAFNVPIESIIGLDV